MTRRDIATATLAEARRPGPARALRRVPQRRPAPEADLVRDGDDLVRAAALEALAASAARRRVRGRRRPRLRP
ncbi:hypothetical protein LUX57_45820 [Actinomadura madurae]|uniref:hypothetical protein n=1 Tax=Actinomadura madurae TaxID=1993 RepID=UPI0020D22D4F|nr:hypothetical protein [Actinomadura madurae]MCP9971532.1 hypothetical protein [Actinomadura madurae]